MTDGAVLCHRGMYHKEGRRAGGWRQQSLGHGQCVLMLDRQRQTGDLQEANQGTKEEDSRNTMSITSSGMYVCTILTVPSHK